MAKIYEFPTMGEEHKLVYAFEDQSESFVLGYELGKVDTLLQIFFAGKENLRTTPMTIHTKNYTVLGNMCVGRGWGFEIVNEVGELAEVVFERRAIKIKE